MLSFFAPNESYQRNEEPVAINMLTARKVLTDADKKLIMERIYINYALVYAYSGNYCCYVNDEKVMLGEGGAFVPRQIFEIRHSVRL